jgi:hypothetical protein
LFCFVFFFSTYVLKYLPFQFFKRSIELEPSNATARATYGYLLQNHGKMDEAIHHFRESIRYGNNDASVHASLGMLLRKNDDTLKDAEDHLRFAFRKVPDDHTAENLAITIWDQLTIYDKDIVKVSGRSLNDEEKKKIRESIEERKERFATTLIEARADLNVGQTDNIPLQWALARLLCQDRSKETLHEAVTLCRMVLRKITKAEATGTIVGTGTIDWKREAKELLVMATDFSVDEEFRNAHVKQKKKSLKRKNKDKNEEGDIDDDEDNNGTLSDEPEEKRKIPTISKKKDKKKENKKESKNNEIEQENNFEQDLEQEVKQSVDDLKAARKHQQLKIKPALHLLKISRIVLLNTKISEKTKTIAHLVLKTISTPFVTDSEFNKILALSVDRKTWITNNDKKRKTNSAKDLFLKKVMDSYVPNRKKRKTNKELETEQAVLLLSTKSTMRKQKPNKKYEMMNYELSDE